MDVRSIAAIAVALVACAVAPARGQVRAELVAGGFTQPVAFVQDPSDATVQLVVQQDGRIRALRDGAVQEADYLDLRAVVRNSGEQGLLGLAFAPDYATSGRVFINFVNTSGHTVVARFRRSAADPLRADPSSRFDLRWPDGQRIIEQPFSNHNGGNLAFGPDGFLYIGMGDGGSGNDPFHNAQNPQTLLGKMLRISVSVSDADPEGYDVPATNPFVGQPGVLGEIWSFGLRNPWRWSFDDPARGGTGALVIADVGQNNWEEISYEPAGRGGRNYGWRNREGAHDNVLSLPPFSLPLIDPIFEYSHSVGGSITGGIVYRASRLGVAFRGRYLFGDFVRGRVWSVRLTVNAATGEAVASDLIEHTGDIGAAAASPSSFGVDAAGEVHVVNYNGNVHRLFDPTAPPEPPGPPPPPPPGPPGPSGGRRRPPGVEPIGFAVPRGSVTPAPGALTTAVGDVPPSGVPATAAGVEAPTGELPPVAVCVETDPATLMWLLKIQSVAPAVWLEIDAASVARGFDMVILPAAFRSCATGEAVAVRVLIRRHDLP
jgi:glucose/arabinose dehydrogenase